VAYEVEIEAENLEKAEELADLEETKSRARLIRIEGKNEFWERFYDLNDPSQSPRSFKRKRK
jgi:hypothetical protein